MELFTFENYELKINKPDVFLVKEFKNLFEESRCKGKGDPKGLLKTKALKELSYIYLVYDWKSPYSEYSEEERMEAAISDTELTEKNLEDPLFITAKDKYINMQDSRVLKLLNSAYRAVDELRLYFDTVDLQEKDTYTGKPVYSAKNVIAEIANLGKVVEGLEQLKEMVMKERESESSLRGGAEPGLLD